MKTVSRQPCVNRESKIRMSQFSYTVIVVPIKMKFLEIVTPPSIYQIHKTQSIQGKITMPPLPLSMQLTKIPPKKRIKKKRIILMIHMILEQHKKP